MKELLKVSVKGVVQGVGFRPFVYGLAKKHHLNGWVVNTSGEVRIDAEGSATELDLFLKELTENYPPQAHITNIKAHRLPPIGYSDFIIRQSIAEAGKYQLISPDLATCADCRADVADTANRRYRYPFTNCTNCGPRFTIIEDIPYDRPRTTMKKFKMCPDCQAEYDNPLNRRFHAQPNACPVCGPRLWLTNRSGTPVETSDPIATGATLLKEGRILAVKGLGGFLLACDAHNASAVETLRYRKHRPAKPFAVMLRNLDEVGKHCIVTDSEAELLGSAAAPIVLLRWKPESTIAINVAPNLKYLGVMLPYTPLHHVLLGDAGCSLVMTSGNLSEEPIAKDNEEALKRLSNVADYFLLHDRDIYSRYDDSVAMVEAGWARVLRRARGMAPYPVTLASSIRSILAVGSQEKNTLALSRDNFAFISQHIGELDDAETMIHFDTTFALYEKLFRIKPEAVACDLHPDYLSSRWAAEYAEKKHLPLFKVQHHHAHIASCLAENGFGGEVIGVAWDGTGYGADGRIWGGEFLRASAAAYTRLAHFEYLPLPGGEAAVKKPYRTALGYMYTLLGEQALTKMLPCLEGIDNGEMEVIKKQIDLGLNTPLTSSAGRLFDATAALIGIRQFVQYDAQAAIELEMAATGIEDDSTYPFGIERQSNIEIVRVKPLFQAIIADLLSGVDRRVIAARFHNAVIDIIVTLCTGLAQSTGLETIALSGGCFQNRILLRGSIEKLNKSGFTVLTHSLVPPNDGDISLGQLAVAAAVGGGKTKEEKQHVLSRTGAD